MSLVVKSKTEDSVTCEVVDGGELKSRRHLNVRGKSATLPSITGWPLNPTVESIFIIGVEAFCSYGFLLCIYVTEKDWDDIKFGVENQVDFYAVSFVKDAQVVHELKNYLQSTSH